MKGERPMSDPQQLPQQGWSRAELLDRLVANRHDDAPWREGRIFSLIYNPGDPELEETLAAVSREYLSENALNPFKFPSLARLEQETADVVSGLLHGPAGAGGLTAGGTESIFSSVHVAREVAYERGISNPVIVTPRTAHPAFRKAAHLLGIEQVRVPVGADFRVDASQLAAAIDERTALVVASAPCYPYGVIDPVVDVAAAAQAAGVLCHVDACLGGLLMPFWERLGEPVPPWDFRVPGVTSISADIHKYGYSYKGASALLWSTPELASKRWWFDDEAWGGGLYGSPTPAGTRPAPPIAGAWAALHTLGEDGYLRLATEVRDTVRLLLRGIEQIDGLQITAAPDLSVFEVSSAELDMTTVGDVLEERRWYPDRQPNGLHFMISPVHAKVANELLADLQLAAEKTRDGRANSGSRASYNV
jgi:sphinganine-1-phosphate aldolase